MACYLIDNQGREHGLLARDIQLLESLGVIEVSLTVNRWHITPGHTFARDIEPFLWDDHPTTF
jgi:hypothetical protein